MAWEVEIDKPKINGWYLCTLETLWGDRYVEELYWYSEIQRFKDKKICDVVNENDVYKLNSTTHKYDIPVNDYIITDKIVAWKKLPKAYTR